MWLPVGGLALLAAGFSAGWKKPLRLLLAHLMVWIRGSLRRRQIVFRWGQPGTQAASFIITVSATSGSRFPQSSKTLALVPPPKNIAFTGRKSEFYYVRSQCFPRRYRTFTSSLSFTCRALKIAKIAAEIVRLSLVRLTADSFPITLRALRVRVRPVFV
jgi:hypothetical protein